MKTLFLILFLIPLSFPAAFAASPAALDKCPAAHERPVAVFIVPSDKKLEAMKKAYGDDFYTIADDAMFYQAKATELLDNLHFPYCFTEQEGRTFKAGKTRYSVDDKCPGWCVILWNGKDKPVSTYAVDVFTYEEYLKKASLH